MRLQGDTRREATSDEVSALRKEDARFKGLVAETLLGRYKAEFVRRDEPERKVEDLELAAVERTDFL